MPQSLSRLVVHIAFSTKGRASIISADVQPRLHAYMAGTLSGIECYPVRIGGMTDHVHVLCALGRTVSLADLIEELKRQSSKWMKQQGDAFREFYWQRGYGAFSVSESNVSAVENYINAQKEHHRKMTFQDELRTLLQKHRIEYDERYVWD